MRRSSRTTNRGIAVLALVLACRARSWAAPPKVGDTVGTLRFSDAQGKLIALDEPGVIYVVDFWALGCKPCLEEMPDLERLAGEYAERAEFVRVAWGDWKAKDLRRLAKLAGAFRPVYGDSEDWMGRFEIRAFPTKLFIRDGVIRDTLVGAGPGSYGAIKAIIEDELGAPDP